MAICHFHIQKQRSELFETNLQNVSISVTENIDKHGTLKQVLLVGFKICKEVSKIFWHTKKDEGY